jgi:hypothetical protein
MVDMKRPQADETAGADSMPVSPEGGQYPYGLCIRLESQELSALGIKELPPVGTEYHITAVGHVTMTRSGSSVGDAEDSAMSIQIMYLEMTEEAESAAEAMGETAAMENAENSGSRPLRTPPRPKLNY